MATLSTPSAAGPDDAGVLSPRRLLIVMTVLVLVEVMSSLESTMVYAALPTIMREHGHGGIVGWLITGFVLVQASSSVIAAKLGDVYGRRRLLAIVLAICVVGSVVSAMASTLTWVIIGRSLQGVSGALLPLACGIIRQAAPRERVPFLIGIVTAALGLAGGAGFILGGYLADSGNWQHIFWLTAIYGSLLLPAVALLPGPAARPEEAPIDVIGGTLFVPAIAAILWVATGGWSIATPGGMALLGAGTVLLAAWLVWELRHPFPLIDVRLLRKRNVALGAAGSALLGLGLINSALLMMMILQQPAATGIGLGLSGTVAGLLKLPTNVSAFVGAAVGGWLAGRYTTRMPVVMGGAVCIVSWASLWLFHDTIWQVLAGVLGVTFASGALMTAMPNLILQEVAVERSSEATGMNLLVRSVFNAVGAQIIAAVLAASRVQTPGLAAPYPSAAGFKTCFALMLATGVGTVAIGLLCRVRRVAPASAAADAVRAEPFGGEAAREPA